MATSPFIILCTLYLKVGNVPVTSHHFLLNTYCIVRKRKKCISKSIAIRLLSCLIHCILEKYIVVSTFC